MKTTLYVSGQINNRAVNENGIIGTLLARDYKDPKYVVIEPKRLGGLFDTETSKHQAGSIWDKEYISPTIDTMQGGYRQPMIVQENLRIRKLTPRECYRLMGFSDTEFDRAENVNSNTQLYKQAGNSIVVDVLEEIFRMIKLVIDL